MKPRASHRVFHGPANQAVSQGHDQRQHEDADQPAHAPFPNQQDSRAQQRRREQGIPADEGHHSVEDGIDQPEVEQPEQLSVQVQQPIH